MATVVTVYLNSLGGRQPSLFTHVAESRIHVEVDEIGALLIREDEGAMLAHYGCRMWTSVDVINRKEEVTS